MNLASHFAGPFAYLAVLVAAIVEGEVLFVTAATLVSQGHLNPVGVAVAGALGATIGDQGWFYLFRGRLRRWLERYPQLRRRAMPLVKKVRRHDSLTVLAIRFSPGIRIALSVACAYADVAAWKFSILSTVTACVWSVGLLTLVAWVGPRFLPGVGISGWWSALVPAILIVILARGLGKVERDELLGETSAHEHSSRSNTDDSRD
jgi:membrane protein DedA with SNARE-associated domain